MPVMHAPKNPVSLAPSGPQELDDIPDPVRPATSVFAATPASPGLKAKLAAAMQAAPAAVPSPAVEGLGGISMDQLQQAIEDAVLRGLEMPLSVGLSTLEARVKEAMRIQGASLDAAALALVTAGQSTNALAAALRLYKPFVPYSATVQAKTPSGFQMALTIQQADQETFLAEVGILMSFLRTQGFAPGEIPF